MFDCRTCGACCCTLVELQKGDRVPRAMVGPGFTMATTFEHRCIALIGRVGQSATCRIYPDRPRVCREVQAGGEMCKAARALFELPGGDMSDRALADAISNLTRRR